MPGPLNQPGHFRQETNGEVEIVFKQENTPEPEHPLPSGVDPSMVPHPNMFDMFHEVDDAETADEIFSILMGSDVDPRKLFIEKYGKDVRWIDV